jgi:hypothetical protein
MKVQGFTTKNILLADSIKENISLPKELLLWGNVENFALLNIDKRLIKVFLLYYFDEIVAGILYYEKEMFYGRIKTGFSPHPDISVPYGHVYFKKQDSIRAQEQLYEVFIQEVTTFITREKFSSFSISLPSEITDMREFYWHTWEITPRYSYTLNLEKVKEDTLSIYVGKKVRNIIKYVREELSPKSITAQEFYQCYKDTYLRQGKPCPKPLVFFTQLQTIPNIQFLGAFDNKTQELTSGIIIGEVDDKAYFVTAGALDKYHNSNGVTLLLYLYFEKLLSETTLRIRSFDFVGANTKKVAYYKSCFQPDLLQHFEVKKKTKIFILIRILRNLFNK